MSKQYGKRIRLSEEEVEMVLESRADNTININGNTALDIHLEERGIQISAANCIPSNSLNCNDFRHI